MQAAAADALVLGLSAAQREAARNTTAVQSQVSVRSALAAAMSDATGGANVSDTAAASITAPSLPPRSTDGAATAPEAHDHHVATGCLQSAHSSAATIGRSSGPVPSVAPASSAGDSVAAARPDAMLHAEACGDSASRHGSGRATAPQAAVAATEPRRGGNAQARSVSTASDDEAAVQAVLQLAYASAAAASSADLASGHTSSLQPPPLQAGACQPSTGTAEIGADAADTLHVSAPGSDGDADIAEAAAITPVALLDHAELQTQSTARDTELEAGVNSECGAMQLAEAVQEDGLAQTGGAAQGPLALLEAPQSAASLNTNAAAADHVHAPDVAAAATASEVPAAPALEAELQSARAPSSQLAAVEEARAVADAVFGELIALMSLPSSPEPQASVAGAAS